MLKAKPKVIFIVAIWFFLIVVIATVISRVFDGILEAEVETVRARPMFISIQEYETGLPKESLAEGKNNEYYAYQIMEKKTLLSTNLYVVKIPVDVLAENEKYVALDGIENGMEFVVKTSKPIIDGSSVKKDFQNEKDYSISDISIIRILMLIMFVSSFLIIAFIISRIINKTKLRYMIYGIAVFISVITGIFIIIYPFEMSATRWSEFSLWEEMLADYLSQKGVDHG